MAKDPSVRASTRAIVGRPIDKATPLMHQRGPALQRSGSLRTLPLGLEDDVRTESVRLLNQVLADTVMMRDMYKKHHWQAAGPTFYQIHLLFDKHYEEQAALVDMLAERVQILGGVALGMPHDVADATHIRRLPSDAEETPVQLSRLLEGHEILIREVREAAHKAADNGDDGTNDVLVSNVLRTNEMQVWFVAEHLVDIPLVHADRAETANVNSAHADSTRDHSGDDGEEDRPSLS